MNCFLLHIAVRGFRHTWVRAVRGSPWLDLPCRCPSWPPSHAGRHRRSPPVLLPARRRDTRTQEESRIHDHCRKHMTIHYKDSCLSVLLTQESWGEVTFVDLDLPCLYSREGSKDDNQCIHPSINSQEQEITSR